MSRMPKPTKCPRCGRENDPSFAFCLECGQSLQRAAAPDGRAPSCTGCGAKIPAGFRFCGQCGRPVPAPDRPPPAGARAPRAAPTGAPAAVRPAPAAAAPRGPSARPRLAAVRPDGSAGAVFPLEQDETVCGREEGAIRLADDPTVSPRHARFTVRGGVLRVEDLGTANGVYLRLKGPHRLGIGEELRVGRQVLRLEPLPRPASPEEHGVRTWGAPDPGCRFRLAQLLEGGGIGDVFPLRAGENVVGREAGEVTFPTDRYVSARHARIDVAGADVTLADAGSSNGTFVRIGGAVELAPGDQLLVGTQLFRVDG
jgi:pSer/pThr/pTyr-binding forkhead associated (FHA) protein